MNRYHLVRHWWLPTGSISEPFVLDRREMKLRPYKGNMTSRLEWASKEATQEALRKWNRIKQAPVALRQRLAERLLLRDADCSRIAALFTQADLYTLGLFAGVPLGTANTVALDSAYVAGTSGDATAVRYHPGVTRTLNSIYFFISSYTGTAANVNDLNLELRNQASAGSTTPDTTATIATAVKDPVSATGWIASTGWSNILSAFTPYFVVIGDTDGDGASYATISYRVPYFESYLSATGINVNISRFSSFITTAGWVSGNSNSSTTIGAFVLAFSDGTSFGCPFSATGVPASNTNQRGLRITTNGLITDLPIYGVIWGTSASQMSGFKIFVGDAAPDSTADHISTNLLYNTASATGAGCLLSAGSIYTLLSGTAYSIVATYSGATNGGPRRADIGTGEDATLRKAMPGAGEFYWRQDDGGSTWANDLIGSIPAMGLLIDGQIAPSGGGVNVFPQRHGMIMKM